MPEQFSPSQQPEVSAASEQAERVSVDSETQAACQNLALECSDELNDCPSNRLKFICAEAGLSVPEDTFTEILADPKITRALKKPLPLSEKRHESCLKIIHSKLTGVEVPPAMPNERVQEQQAALEDEKAASTAIETREDEIDQNIIDAKISEAEIKLDVESEVGKGERLDQEYTEIAEDRDANAAGISEIIKTRVSSGNLKHYRDETTKVLEAEYEGDALANALAVAEGVFAKHEQTLNAMQAVFTPEEIQTVFGGSLVNTVSLNLRGENKAQIYADVFARIDAGFANDDDRRREVRAQVEAQLGIKAHAVEAPKNASEMQDSLKKGYGTETRTETQTVEEPPGSGNYVEKEVVVSETTIPFSEAFPFVVSHEPYVVMYPKTPGASRYQVQGRVAGLASVETTVDIPPTGALPKADIHAAINKAFIAGNFRNAGLNGALEHLCGRSDATLGTSADVSAGAIGQTDMLQNVMQMFGGEMMDIRTGFLSAGALKGMTPDLRWLTIDGDFGAMNQNDPAKVQNMMTALFDSSHGEIANNMSKARGVINSGGAETPSFQALYKAVHPEDVANGFANLKAVMGAQSLAAMNLG